MYNNNPYNHYHQHSSDSYAEPVNVDRPDGFEDDIPTTPPPQPLTQQFSQQIPQGFFTTQAQSYQIRSIMCRCLGNWGLLGLRFQGPFGREIWFYPTDIRRNNVSGYTWQNGRRQRVRYNYSQIRNFMCFG
jgi:hypothetical protein